MFRLMIALAWMGAANLQNAAQCAPGEEGVHICGDARLVPPVGPQPKQRGSDCAGACHAAFRRCDGLPGETG